MARIMITFIALVLASTSNVEAKKQNALIIDGQNNHNWKGTTPVLREYLEGSGLFSVDVATTGDDPADFTPDFSEYDVIVLNYNGADWPKATQSSFVS